MFLVHKCAHRLAWVYSVKLLNSKTHSLGWPLSCDFPFLKPDCGCSLSSSFQLFKQSNLYNSLRTVWKREVCFFQYCDLVCSKTSSVHTAPFLPSPYSVLLAERNVFVFSFLSFELWVFKHGSTPTLSLHNLTLFHGLSPCSANAVYCSHCMASQSLLKWPRVPTNPGRYKTLGARTSQAVLSVLRLAGRFFLYPRLFLSWNLFLCSFQPFGLSYTIRGTLNNMHLPSNHSSLDAWSWWQCPFLVCWVCSRLSDPDCAEHPLCLMSPSPLIRMFPFLVTGSKSLWVCASLHRIPRPRFGLSSGWWGRTRRHHINSIHLSVQPKIPYLFAVHLIFSFKRVSSRGLKLFRHSQGANHQSA